MDPNKAYEELIELLGHHWQDAEGKARMLDLTSDLLDWINARGFLPAKMLAAGMNSSAAVQFLRLLNDEAQYLSPGHDIRGVRNSKQVRKDASRTEPEVSTGNPDHILVSGVTIAEAIKNLIHWTLADSVAATEEGWDLFDIGGGVLDLQRIDEEGVFDTDFEAEQFVKQRAAEGSELHKKAFLCLTPAPSNWPTEHDADPIEEAVQHHWGSRCPEVHTDCACCKAWQAYDHLKLWEKKATILVAPYGPLIGHLQSVAEYLHLVRHEAERFTKHVDITRENQRQCNAINKALNEYVKLCQPIAVSTGNSPQQIIADALRKLEKIVMTDDVDAGVVLLPITGPDGSAPLGCALYDLWRTLKKGQPCTATDAPSNPSSTPTLST